jgi:phosphatidylglycerophosphate synthase
VLIPMLDPARDIEIDVPSNRLVIHPVGAWLLPFAIRAGIHPNAVSLAGLGLGLLAAASFRHWPDARFALAGWCLLLGWLVLDGLDGALARATGRASAFGRFVDGFADYGVFVVVHVALALSLGGTVAAFVLMLAAGAAHAVQSAFYEATRATWFRRARRQFDVPERTAAGGAVERFYNAMEQALGHRPTAFDRLCAARQAPDGLLARWQALARPRFRPLWLLSSNARAHLILIACLVGDPRLAWWCELLLLSAVAAAGGWWWRRAEGEAMAVEGDDHAP